MLRLVPVRRKLTLGKGKSKYKSSIFPKACAKRKKVRAKRKGKAVKSIFDKVCVAKKRVEDSKMKKEVEKGLVYKACVSEEVNVRKKKE